MTAFDTIEHKRKSKECKKTKASYSVLVKFKDGSTAKVTRDLYGVVSGPYSYERDWFFRRIVEYNYTYPVNEANFNLRVEQNDCTSQGITIGNTIYFPSDIHSVTFGKVVVTTKEDDCTQ